MRGEEREEEIGEKMRGEVRREDRIKVEVGGERRGEKESRYKAWIIITNLSS